MPGDLLRYLGGPAGFSWWWWIVAALCAAGIIGWYAGVFVWTLPPARLRRLPVLGSLHSRLLRRRFSRSITTIAGHHRAGGMPAAHAAAAISRTLRSFLYVATGARAQYMHIDDIAGHHALAPAAPVISALNDAQFSTEHTDIDRVASAAVEVIRTWT
ncbi:hypothetical protein [Mycolicibacterium stellerae]|uniref:hypothetical protein n=1 Tax=Mycolicibacterium stellerae TaxID=2358193 RepID=UPI000F0B20BC|nr:hypothetical protein [Mycolicibacterium stellerae]